MKKILSRHHVLKFTKENEISGWQMNKKKEHIRTHYTIVIQTEKYPGETYENSVEETKIK